MYFMACVELLWRIAMQLEMNVTSLPCYAVTGRFCALCYLRLVSGIAESAYWNPS